MSTTVTYKGSTLTTATNQTRTLKTQGKYMEGDVIITDVSSSGAAVVVTDTEDVHGGTIREITAVSLEGITVNSSVLLRGYTAIDSSGNLVNGAYNGGGGTITLQTKSVTPTETAQVITADTGYDGLEEVDVAAISSNYVGSGISRKSATDVTVDTSTGMINIPAGYYASTGEKQLSTVSGSTITPTESEQTAVAANKYTLGAIKVGAISSTYVGSGITQRDSDDLTSSAATVSVPAGYYAEAASKSVTIGSATGPSSLSGSSATITTGTNTITLTKTGVTTTPTVTAGYVAAATNSTATVALTASITVNPTPTASGATVTIPAGYYSAQTTKSVTTMTLPTSASASATSGYTSKATISRSTSDQYINIPPGYNSAGGYYKINAVANGSATGPTSLSGSSATISTGTNTLTLTKTGVTTTPTVNAGYVSSATASTATVTLTASVTTKAAATITPTTTNQTIASGTYLTGTQTISGDANLVGSNIVSGKSIFGVSGTVVLQNYYTGSSAPSSSTGQNGDLYLQA
jgi:hypothetical protein